MFSVETPFRVFHSEAAVGRGKEATLLVHKQLEESERPTTKKKTEGLARPIDILDTLLATPADHETASNLAAIIADPC